MKKLGLLFLSALMIFSLVACSTTGTTPNDNDDETAQFPDELYLEPDPETVLELNEVEIPLTMAPAVPTTLMPSADGTVEYKNSRALIDASNAEQGYVMIKSLGTSTSRLKVLVTGPSNVQYSYNLNTDGEFEVFPLSDGSGTYKLGVYQNVGGTKYTALYTKQISVTLENEFAPFLLPNQYVNYTEDSKVVEMAEKLTANCTTDLEKITAVYNYVVKNLSYDYAKASSVESGYLPDVDEIITLRKGICFDYAAVMAAMLRSQGVPTKLVVGYTGSAYHAWINTYSEESGWVQGVIFFDGTSWKLMDPTFASTGNSSAKVMQYIGDGKNYSEKYLY